MNNRRWREFSPFAETGNGLTLAGTILLASWLIRVGRAANEGLDLHE